MSRIPWRFTDLKTSEVYFLPVNPDSDAGSNGIRKGTHIEALASTYISPSNSLIVNASVILDAPDQEELFSYTGTLYTKEEYDKFIEWSSKNYPWELRDDLGREFLIYVTEFVPERKRSAKFRWKHTYTFSGLVIRELGV